MSMKIVAAAAVTLGVLLAPAQSEAGQSTPQAPTCVRNADGSGWCNGSIQGFRTSSDAGAYVEFQMEHTGWKYFYASLNSQNYSCNPNSTVGAIWSTALSAHGYFYIIWDTTSTCTTLYVTNDSSDI